MTTYLPRCAQPVLFFTTTGTTEMSRPACKAVLSEAVVTGGEALGEKYGGASACKAVPRRQLRHNKVLSFRQFSYCLRPGTVSRVTTASLSIALQAIPPHAILQHIPPLGATSLYFFLRQQGNVNVTTSL